MIADYRTEYLESILIERYDPNEYPVLYEQMAAWAVRKPFSGLQLLDATPLFINTLLKHLALIKAGATLYVGLSDTIAYDSRAKDLLRSAGIPLLHNKQAAMDLDLILDCAASFSHWKSRLGYVELTRSGFEQYKALNKRVFLADNGKIKQIETLLGTGEAYFRAMKQLGYDQWKERKLVIFGSGKVGRGIAIHARKLGALVALVSDPEQTDQGLPAVEAECISFSDSQAVGRAVKNAYAVVMATGRMASFQADCPPEAWQQSEALFANMGVEDEFGPSVPASRVLMHKKTLNFILDEPTRLCYLEATMALHNRGAEYLLKHPEAKAMIEPPAELEKELLDICRSKAMISNEIDHLFAQN
ncbi:MAG: hypothetical protein PHF38_06135 [Bacteroidales bacterium]|nr:hypothetical protein [Bacteroidales bacterium]MDD4429802.1 hypothetical protein [Bacteroidales bacterium]